MPIEEAGEILHTEDIIGDKMKSIFMIKELIDKYKDNTIIRKNGTLLLNPTKLPKARHILYKGLTEDFVKEYLVDEYKNDFPIQYTNFLRHFNGVDLFMFKIITDKYEFAMSGVTIYGLPRTKPYNRPNNMEEPFDVRIEDLRRHDNIPDIWLKVGTYRIKYGCKGEADIYIDCNTQHVYSVKVDQYMIEEQWTSFDDCLSDLICRSLDSNLEYYF